MMSSAKYLLLFIGLATGAPQTGIDYNPSGTGSGPSGTGPSGTGPSGTGPSATGRMAGMEGPSFQIWGPTFVCSCSGPAAEIVWQPPPSPTTPRPTTTTTVTTTAPMETTKWWHPYIPGARKVKSRQLAMSTSFNLWGPSFACTCNEMPNLPPSSTTGYPSTTYAPWQSTTYEPWGSSTYEPWGSTTYQPWGSTTYAPWGSTFMAF